MHIKKLKVRARKTGYETICAPAMLEMLGCWAASNDLHSTGKCQQAAAKLHECMRNSSSRQVKKSSTINYHLARLQKVLN
ncbi:hypothetical protein SCHPADRAFT_837652 [Schizopora paradoxa]|uniref:CHCH domain-containing protein n=1 Tax=Schizopora paradoxa TaxID=27342 RepID=A0A0H2R5V8_9AGAM|nr:hypothetical protein SCHPADRAFT_837652 [Schizopora paradoxa]